MPNSLFLQDQMLEPSWPVLESCSELPSCSVQKSWNTLELCCGDGTSSSFFIQALLGRKVKLASIDLNDFICGKAKDAKDKIEKLMAGHGVRGRKVPVTAKPGNMLDLKLDNGHYEMIMGYWALIYVQNSKILDFLRMLHGKLVEGGILLIVENVNDEADLLEPDDERADKSGKPGRVDGDVEFA
jgi:SAM-dependent methyltransferase